MPRKTQPQPDPEPEPEPAPRARRPVTDLDAAISAAINWRREQLPDPPTKGELADAAGYGEFHGRRMLKTGEPRQAWTVTELSAYAGALGVSAGSILVAAGVDRPTDSLVERILADPDLAPGDKGTLVGLVQVMLRAHSS